MDDRATKSEQPFQLRLRESNVPEEKLLSDLRRVADEFGRGRVGTRLYTKHGNYSWDTFKNRFGSWNQALDRAGFPINNELNISDVRLFENLEHVWIALGRQPGRRDMIPPHSEYSEGPYNRRFGSWNKALQAFTKWIISRCSKCNLGKGPLSQA